MSVLCVCALSKERAPEKWDRGFQVRQVMVGNHVHSLRLSVQLLGSGDAGLSGQPQLWEFHTYDGHDQQSKAHHTLVCHFWPSEPSGHEHMLSPRANRGHPSQCRLSSLAMCTRPAMWTRSDDVPRETRCGGLGSEEAEWDRGVRGERGRVEERGKDPTNLVLTDLVFNWKTIFLVSSKRKSRIASQQT